MTTESGKTSAHQFKGQANTKRPSSNKHHDSIQSKTRNIQFSSVKIRPNVRIRPNTPEEMTKKSMKREADKSFQ